MYSRNRFLRLATDILSYEILSGETWQNNNGYWAIKVCTFDYQWLNQNLSSNGNLNFFFSINIFFWKLPKIIGIELLKNEGTLSFGWIVQPAVQYMGSKIFVITFKV